MCGENRIVELFGSQQNESPPVCGENGLRRNLRRKIWGSPPRMRGKLFVALLSVSSSRITPACVGKFHNFFMHLVYHTIYPKFRTQSSLLFSPYPNTAKNLSGKLARNQRMEPKGKQSNLTASPSAKGSSVSPFSTSIGTSRLSFEYQDVTMSLSSCR